MVILSAKTQLLTDDVEIIGRAERNITTALTDVKKESANMAQSVNETKTEHTLLTNRDVWTIGYQP